jgi:hypothetical protein
MPKVDLHVSKNMRKPSIIANHNGTPNPTAGREKIPGAASLRTPLLWCRRSSGHKHPEPRLRWEVCHMILHLGDVRIILLGRCTLHSGGAGYVQEKHMLSSRSSLLLTPGLRSSTHHAVGPLRTTLWLGQSACPSRMCAHRPTGPPCLYGCTIVILPSGGQVVPLFLLIAAPRLQGSIYTPLQPPTFSLCIPGPWQAQNVRGKINSKHITRKEIPVRDEGEKFWLEWGRGSA